MAAPAAVLPVACPMRAPAPAPRAAPPSAPVSRFVGGPAASDVLVAGRKAAVYPGGELLVAARLSDVGRTTVIVEGTFQRRVTKHFSGSARLIAMFM